MIQAMVDKGLSGQDIADIAKAGEAKIDRTAAERQARHRAKKKAAPRNAVTSRRDPPIERIHTPGSDISPDGENQNERAIRDVDWPDLPDWLPPKPWNAFLAMRDRKGKWPTPDAVGLIVGKLDRWRAQGHDPGEVLNNSTENAWTGIFEPKAKHDDRPTRQHPQHQRASVSEIGRELAAGYAGAGGGVAQLLPRLGSAGGNG
jgi:hypothetical protein